MKVVLLGSGYLMSRLIRTILSKGHEIIAVGTNKGSSLNDWKLDSIGIKPIVLTDFHEAITLKPDVVLMYSYTPLIDGDSISKQLFVNIHYALLPRFRGFHGFIWSMINDEKEMGYTVHQVEEGIDNGPIYFQHSVTVNDHQDINNVRAVLDEHLVNNIGKYLTQIENKIQPRPQDESKAIYVTKRKPEDGLIDWNWPARLVFNHIRALTPPATPGAYSFYKGTELIITRATYIDAPKYFITPGKVVAFYDNSILVKCSDSIIQIDEVIYNGKQCFPKEVIRYIGTQLGI